MGGSTCTSHFIQRTVKRLHLSKVKTTKYYDSGCLAVFYFISLVWGVDIILSCGYATNPTLLWREYPHTLMRCATAVVQGVEMKCFPPTLSLFSLSLKFFMLTQMAFWLHCYPELIFTKTKKVVHKCLSVQGSVDSNMAACISRPLPLLTSLYVY